MPTARAARSSSPASPASAATSAGKPVLRFRVRVTSGDQIAVGPGKIALLEAIEHTGSITAAAKSLDMSYRRAWLLLDEMNRSLREPAVSTSQGGSSGGGAVLTDSGRKLVALYRRIEEEAASACKQDIRTLMGLLAR
ncbi:MAG: LysR family transcriptional regulator [Proteobacteria bacterium]|nr:LysR family transcriptional regulator [Pseudomonadota bacterium]